MCKFFMPVTLSELRGFLPLITAWLDRMKVCVPIFSASTPVSKDFLSAKIIIDFRITSYGSAHLKLNDIRYILI